MKLSEVVKKNLSDEALDLWFKEQLEATFKAGQQSGINISNRIYAFKHKRRCEVENEEMEQLDDAINIVFADIKATLPCMRHESSCQYKPHTNSFIDRVRDTFTERMEFAKQRVYIDKLLHSPEEE